MDNLERFLNIAIQEDLGDGDHTSEACIPENTQGTAHLLIKDHGILAGVEVARRVFEMIDPDIHMDIKVQEGEVIRPGIIAFEISGRIRSILLAERLALNIMQHMSGVATQTKKFVDQVQGLKAKILDTRKTTPGMRFLDKEAVRTGGGENHRMGLFDMILIKDNHIDYLGSLEKAVDAVHDYFSRTGRSMKIVIEARDLDSVYRIMAHNGVDRIMLDNFSLEDTREAVEYIKNRLEIESSGGITLQNVRAYALCGVDYISVGALTHQIQSLDMSLNAVIH